MSQRELRVVVLGEAGVGKSALVVRFLTGRFLHKYDPTLEDEYVKEVELGGEKYTLRVVDTAGQEYNQLRYHFCTADVLLIAFSLTDSSSLETALHIRQLANSYCGQFSKIPAVLIGTKLDLDSMRVVGFEEGVSMAKEVGCSYIETSAACNRGVSKAFAKAVRLVPFSMPDYGVQEHKLQKKQSSTIKSVKCLLKRCSEFTLRKNSEMTYNTRMSSV